MSILEESIVAVGKALTPIMHEIFNTYTNANIILNKDFSLVEAMKYSVFNNSKRIRPFLCLAVAKIYNDNIDQALYLAAALEFIHKYSLVHDDLPCMDNDDYRNGQPSTHKKFDEVTAVLAGNALLTLAFEVLSDKKIHNDAEIRCNIIKVISSAIGTNGVLGGQMYDINAVNSYNAEELIQIDLLKTGKLFSAACEGGSIWGNASLDEQKSFREFGLNFGIAYQLADDMDDYANDKKQSLIIDMLGFDNTRKQLNHYINKALDCLNNITDNTDKLQTFKHLALFIEKKVG